MEILVVFIMYLGLPHVETTIFNDKRTCMTSGREFAELLKEHSNVKDVKWQCLSIENIGKPT
jgi:hypothetical protein